MIPDVNLVRTKKFKPDQIISSSRRFEDGFDVSQDVEVADRRRPRQILQNVPIPDVSTVLNEVRKLPTRVLKNEIAILEAMDDVLEVNDLSREDVVFRIEDLIVSIVDQIISVNAFDLDVPNRSNKNQIYIEEIDRNVLGSKISKREFLNFGQSRKVAISTRVTELLHEVLTKGIHVTKRDLFYTDVKLFQDQSESDTVLDDVSCMLGCTRTSLGVIASNKGVVVGRVQFRESGDYIDCTKMGVGGKAISPNIEAITEITSDAEFIILVEKEAAYMRLAEDRIYNKYPCVVITGKGQPDVATRLFLRKITDYLKIPILALVDSDPYGLKILSFYSSGSKNMSYDSNHLTTSDIKWLGVRPSDLDRYRIPQQCRLPLTLADRKAGEDLLKEAFIQKNLAWVSE